jgi:hypothetical protein
MNIGNLVKTLGSPRLPPNLDNENLITFNNIDISNQYKKTKKLTIGEENLKKLMNGTRTCRNSKKFMLPLKNKDLLTEIDENTYAEGSVSDKNSKTMYRKNRNTFILMKPTFRGNNNSMGSK